MSDLHAAFARYAAAVAARPDDGTEYQMLSYAVHQEYGMAGVYLLGRLATEQVHAGQLEAASMAAIPDAPPLDW